MHWIDVKDRMPEENSLILTWPGGQSTVEVCKFQDGKFWELVDGYNCCIRTPEFWNPITEPKKKKGE